MSAAPPSRCEPLGSPLTAVRLRLPYRPPLAWEPLQCFLASRGSAGVEAMLGRSYLRTVCVDGSGGWFSARPAADEPALEVEIAPSLASAADRLLPRIRRLFDLDAHPQSVDGHLATDPHLAPLVARTPGLRVPGAMDGFELALRAILGQQVTVKAATTLFGRFSAAFGAPALTPHEGLKYFAPTAKAVAGAAVQKLISLGLTGQRAQTVSDLAKAMCEGGLSLDSGAPVDSRIEALQAIPGIGPWTAQYIAMRALRDPDAFPHTDLGLLKATELRPRDLLARSQAWRPWRAYAALHLWNGLNAGG